MPVAAWFPGVNGMTTNINKPPALPQHVPEGAFPDLKPEPSHAAHGVNASALSRDAPRKFRTRHNDASELPITAGNDAGRPAAIDGAQIFAPAVAKGAQHDHSRDPGSG